MFATGDAARLQQLSAMAASGDFSQFQYLLSRPSACGILDGRFLRDFSLAKRAFQPRWIVVRANGTTTAAKSNAGITSRTGAPC